LLFPDTKNITHVLEKLKRVEAQNKELVDHIKKLKAHLPAAMDAAIIKGLCDPETLKLVKKITICLSHPLTVLSKNAQQFDYNVLNHILNRFFERSPLSKLWLYWWVIYERTVNGWQIN